MEWCCFKTWLTLCRVELRIAGHSGDGLIAVTQLSPHPLGQHSSPSSQTSWFSHEKWRLQKIAKAGSIGGQVIGGE